VPALFEVVRTGRHDVGNVREADHRSLSGAAHGEDREGGSDRATDDAVFGGIDLPATELRNDLLIL
jgi:hypothetical protein